MNIFDVRLEKIVKLSATQLRLFLDVFNILNGNANAPERISFQTGHAFEAHQIILAPLVLRMGFRFDW